MRIAIDARKLHDFGIGTYVRNVVRQLARLDRETEYLLICRPEDADYARTVGDNFAPLLDPAGNYSLREQFSVPLALARARVDLFHAPHYVVSPLTRCPTVVTIHDCIHLRFPEYLPHRRASYYARFVMRSAAHRARRVLTVSEASKRDILHYLGVPADKVEVIYNGLDERFASAPSDAELARVRDRYRLDAPYVLYAGNIKPHKNLARLIDAFARLRQRLPGPLTLLLLGDEISNYPNLRRLVQGHRLNEHVRFLGFVSDATLAALYRLAALFVFPSLYEGFGLPPLEAMASGTPVVTSNASSLPEVVGDAALTVDPGDAQALADAMARVLTEASLRADLVARGHARVRQFSWERAVARIRAVYDEVCAEGVREIARA